ncbi:hypothetical protein [Thermodesulfitimonas sp.]
MTVNSFLLVLAEEIILPSYYTGPQIEDKFILDDLRAYQRSSAAPAPFSLPGAIAEKLTLREREVLELLLRAWSNK